MKTDIVKWKVLMEMALILNRGSDCFLKSLSTNLSNMIADRYFAFYHIYIIKDI